MYSILDIDECDKYPGLCPHGTCQNLVGSWMCKCDTGFDATNANQKCEGKSLYKLIQNVKILYISERFYYNDIPQL